jgi:predicted CoA-binding protein
MSSPKKTVVVVGASSNPARVSNMLMERLARHPRYEAVPVHPALREVAGKPVRSSLAAVEAGPDVVTLYLGAAHSTPLESELVRLKPGKVIFNPGAENPALASRLHAEGIETENACSLVLLGQGLL